MLCVLFLDIDRVLAHWGSDNVLDPHCIAELDQLLEARKPRVVLISAWRDRYGLDEIQRRLTIAGFRGRVTDVVPTFATLNRADEIETYLAALPTPRRIAILDDIPIGQHLRKHQVLVDDFVGLTSADVDLAIRMLA